MSTVLVTNTTHLLSQIQKISQLANEIFSDIMVTVNGQQSRIKSLKERVKKLEHNTNNLEKTFYDYNPSIFYDYHTHNSNDSITTIKSKINARLYKNGNIFTRANTTKYIERLRNNERIYQVKSEILESIKTNHLLSTTESDHSFTVNINKNKCLRLSKLLSILIPYPFFESQKFSNTKFVADEWTKKINSIIDERKKERYYRRRRRRKQRRRNCRHHFQPPNGKTYAVSEYCITIPATVTSTLPPPVPPLPLGYPNNIDYLTPAQQTVQKRISSGLMHAIRNRTVRSVHSTDYNNSNYGRYDFLQDMIKKRQDRDTSNELTLKEEIYLIDLLIHGYCVFGNDKIGKYIPMDVRMLIFLFYGNTYKITRENEWVFDNLKRLNDSNYDSSSSDYSDAYCWCTDSD